MRRIILLFLLLVTPCVLFAQNEKKQPELTIFTGISFLEIQNVNGPCLECLSPLPPFIETNTLDSGILIGFKFGYYLNETVEVEGNFSVAPNQDFTFETSIFCPAEPCPLTGDEFAPLIFFKKNAVSYSYNGNLVYNFNRKTVTPFVTAGIGGLSTDLGEETRSDLVFNFGGGAKFYFKNVGVRFELNDQVIPDHFLSGKTEHDLQVQYGFFFRL